MRPAVLRPRALSFASFASLASLESLAPFALWFALLPVVGCTRRDPPAPAVSPSVALPELPPPAPSTLAAASALGLLASSAPPASALPRDVAPGIAGAARSTGSTSGPTPSGASAEPAGANAEPSARADAPGSSASAAPGQTHDMPPASGPAFEARAAGLWQAIVEDSPDVAMPFFFPLAAYQQVKDVGDPEADWTHRLVSAFRRDIHALHARVGGAVGAAGDGAVFVGLEVPQNRARWVEPGEEWNKLGYYRVFGSKLRYTVGGEAHTFEIKSLISWRGEWYVVHLHAIK